MDFILDNLVIEKSAAHKTELDELVNANSGRYEVNYSADSWTEFTKAMEEAEKVLDDASASQETVDNTTAALEKAVEGLEVIAVTLSGSVKDEAGTAVPDVEISADNGVKTTTDGNGHYVLPGVALGERRVTAESSVFSTNTQTLTASEEELEPVVKKAMAAFGGTLQKL